MTIDSPSSAPSSADDIEIFAESGTSVNLKFRAPTGWHFTLVTQAITIGGVLTTTTTPLPNVSAWDHDVTVGDKDMTCTLSMVQPAPLTLETDDVSKTVSFTVRPRVTVSNPFASITSVPGHRATCRARRSA